MYITWYRPTMTLDFSTSIKALDLIYMFLLITHWVHKNNIGFKFVATLFGVLPPPVRLLETLSLKN